MGKSSKRKWRKFLFLYRKLLKNGGMPTSNFSEAEVESGSSEFAVEVKSEILWNG